MGLYSRCVFPHVLEWVTASPAMTRCREIVLASASGAVLEIGFGTGRNLPYYPRATESLTAIDVNAGMTPRARDRVERTRLVVDHRVMNAETLAFDDGRFDAVVSTWTLCSIPDVQRALAEVGRVLKPGGHFLFVEHGRSDDPAVRRWQDRLAPVFRWLGDGCHPNRDIRGLIEAQGLEIDQLDRFYLEGVPRVGGYTYRGIARRAAETFRPVRSA